MKKLIILFFTTILVLSTSGCGTRNQSFTIDELELKQIAWDSLGKSTKNTIIGDENDIQYLPIEGSIVTKVVNNAPPDVWKKAELRVVDSRYLSNIKTKHEKTIIITFETDLRSKILRYIDPISKKVIYKEVVPRFHWQ